MRILKIAVGPEPKFSTTVKIHVQGPKDWLIEPDTESVAVSFDINEEWRSWGLKEIHVGSFFGVTRIGYKAENYGSPEVEAQPDIQGHGEFTIDLSKVEKEVSAGGGCYVTGPLEIYLTEDFQVDYANTRLPVTEPVFEAS